MPTQKDMAYKTINFIRTYGDNRFVSDTNRENTMVEFLILLLCQTYYTQEKCAEILNNLDPETHYILAATTGKSYFNFHLKRFLVPAIDNAFNNEFFKRVNHRIDDIYRREFADGNIDLVRKSLTYRDAADRIKCYVISSNFETSTNSEDSGNDLFLLPGSLQALPQAEKEILLNYNPATHGSFTAYISRFHDASS